MSVVLYDYWRSSASYRVRIALALKDIPYQSRTVNLVAGDQRAPDHLDRNPQGLVPVLDIDGLRLTQSMAIIEYLDETREGPPLLPVAPDSRAQARAVALAIACDIHPVSNLKVLAKVASLTTPQVRERWNSDNIAEGLAAVEAMLDHPSHRGRFCVGEEPSIADCALIPQLYNAERWGVPIDHLPKIAAIGRLCAGHPAFAAAHPERFAPLHA
jgi:maleylacetoacetate isomerase